MTNEKIIPPGDYKVSRGTKGGPNTVFTILEGVFKGRFLDVPNHLVPDTILTVTVEEEVTTTERNVVRFKGKRGENVFKTRPSDGTPADGWLKQRPD